MLTRWQGGLWLTSAQLSKPLLHSHPVRKQLEQAVERAYAYERTSCPTLEGDGNYYWLYNPGTLARDILVKSDNLRRDFGKPPVTKHDGSAAGPHVIFDLNPEQDTSLYMYSWSPSGKYFTAILQKAGSDWQDIRTIDTVTGATVGDDLTGAKFTFGACWLHNTVRLLTPKPYSLCHVAEVAKGFVYKAIIKADGSQYSKMDGAYGIFYHRLNTPQSQDVLVWHGEGPDAIRQIVGRPFVMSAKENDLSTRSWMLWDIYQNTNPETETFVIELPEDTPDMGRVLAQTISETKRWLSRGYTGESKCTSVSHVLPHRTWADRG